MTRARTDIKAIESDITHALMHIRKQLDPADASQTDDALVTLETFCAVALRVMAKSNPSKVRSEAMNVEIQNRLPA